MFAISASVGVVLFSFIQTAYAQFNGPCVIYGADFPGARNPSKDSAVIQARTAIQEAIESAFTSAGPYGKLDSGNTSFSVDIYDTSETDSIFTYHHTGAAMRNATHGVSEVDSNTVYRLGSISKLLTVYIYLLEAGDTSYNDPVTKYIPELATYVKTHPAGENHQIDYVDWSEITVGALASQLAGIGRYITQDHWFDEEVGEPSWPAPDDFEQELCGQDGYFNAACNRKQFFQVFTERPPVVAPFRSAIYSNSAYTILGYVIEAITGTPLKTLFLTGLVERIGLNATTYNVPSSSKDSIVPVSLAFSKWGLDVKTTNPAGGYFSSTNDMRKIGRSILSTEYLSRATTQRWFQPHSFNADPRGAIGSPFEMIRAPDSNDTQKISWVFTKAGDIGVYSTLVGYFPGYTVGFTVLTAWSAYTADVIGVDSGVLGNIIISLMHPALESAAKSQAIADYTGTYSDPASNSTIVVASDQYPGLSLTHWTTNGSDVLAQFLLINGLNSSAFARLIPAGLSNSVGGVTTATAWRVMFSYTTPPDSPTQPVTSLCFQWVEVDAIMYGRYGLDSIVFNVDSSGVATSVEPRALRQRLPKVA